MLSIISWMCFMMLFQVSNAFNRFSAKLTDMDDGITKRNR